MMLYRIGSTRRALGVLCALLWLGACSTDRPAGNPKGRDEHEANQNSGP